MELNVRNDSKIVEVWLTRNEKQDAQLQKKLKLVYQSFHEAGYMVATFLSGERALDEVTSGLICYNRKRIAQLEVEQGKEQGPAMTM